MDILQEKSFDEKLGGDPPVVNMRIADKIHSITLELLQDEQGRTELASTCNAAPPPIRISLPHLLEWPSSSRIECFRFINSLSCECRFVATPKKSFDDIFSAMLAMISDTNDLDKHQASRRAALETAAVIYPNALEGACTKLAIRLKGLGIKGTRTESLIKEARQIVKENELGKPEQVSSKTTTPVRDVLDDAPVGQDDVVPADWTLSRGGVWLTSDDDASSQISAPVLVCERHVDVTRKIESLTLAWWRDGRWQRRVVDRAAVASTRTIIDELAPFGVPVTSNNAAALVQFLADYEAANLDNLPLTQVTRQLGWQGEHGSDGFLCGTKLIVETDKTKQQDTARQAVVFRGSDDGDDQIASAFRQRGSFKEWKKTVAAVATYPRAKLALYVAFVPPLLPILESPNFAFDTSGPTTGGKTTGLRVAASVWGNPDERDPASVLGTWDATAVWRERASAILNNLPFLLDDTKLAPRPEEVAKTIYAVVQGRGRGRGTTRGLAGQETWRTVLMTSGEQPAISFTQDGGTRPRVLTIWGSPFGETSEATGKIVRRLNEQVVRHHGHAGPRAVQYLLDIRSDWDARRTVYRDSVKEYETLAANNQFAARMAPHFAAIKMAAWLAHEALDLPWAFSDPIKPLWNELVEGAKDADRSAAALRYIRDWANGHQEEFFGRNKENRQPHGGWAGRWNKNVPLPEQGDDQENWPWIGFIPARLRAVLKEGGFEPESVVRTWRDDKSLAVTKEKKKTRFEVKARVGEATPWLIAVTRAAFEKVSQ